MTTPFPNCVVEVLIAQYKLLTTLTEVSDSTGTHRAVYNRALRPTDAAMSVGITAMNWEPDESSTEMPSNEPTVSTYYYAIQAMVKHGDQQQGNALHGLLSKSVRAMLYRDEPTRLALGQLSETSLGTTERTQLWGVRQQRFANNEIGGQFYFLSTAEFWVQTESVNA